ncbi:MAG: S8 family peptidase [Nanoarchaeota archaeon]|mgnify:FL=1
MISARVRQRTVFSRIEENLKSSEPLEVIIEVDERRKDKVARELDRVGKTLNVFDYVPYVAALMEPKDAQAVANHCFGRGSDRFYSRLFTSSLSALRGIDVASEFSIIPVTEKKNEFVVPFEEMWHLTNIGAYSARQYATGKGVRGGIIDTGIDYSHKELVGRFESLKGVDIIDDGSPMDQNGHGTHVAGLAAGQTVGVATGMTLYAIRVLDENGSGSEVGVMQGIEWAMDNELEIVNMSLGSGYATRAFEELCNLAYKQGMVIVAAAGNDGAKYKSYPAAFGESVIAVTAVDSNDNHAYFSNMWETNDISAPGVDILSSFPGDRYKRLDGTSMASPLAFGSLALGLEIVKSSEPLEYTMKESAKELGFGMAPDEQNEMYGAGLVQADNFCRRLAHMESINKKGEKLNLLEKILTWQ